MAVGIDIPPSAGQNAAVDAFFRVKAYQNQQADQAYQETQRQQEQQAYQNQQAQDAAVRGVHVDPGMSSEAQRQAYAGALSNVPGGGAALLNMRAADWQAQAKAAQMAQQYQQQRDLVNARVAGQEHVAGVRQAGQERIAGMREGGANARAAMSHQDAMLARENVLEGHIASILGNADTSPDPQSQVDLAHQFAQAHGLDLAHNEQFWTAAKQDRGFRALVAYGGQFHDDAFMAKLIDSYQKTGDYNAALQAAGPPPVSHMSGATPYDPVRAEIPAAGRMEGSDNPAGLAENLAYTQQFLKNQPPTVQPQDLKTLEADPSPEAQAEFDKIYNYPGLAHYHLTHKTY